MSNVRSTTLPSFPLLPILGLILVTLKLTGFIAWSWWLVLLPFYGVAALGLAGLLICVWSQARSRWLRTPPRGSSRA